MSHNERLSATAQSIRAAEQRFLAALDALEADAARKRPDDGGWSPAQIAWHVAQTNEVLAAVITGALPMAQPAAPDFKETEWSAMTIPARIKTMPQLEPPDAVSTQEVIDKYKASVKLVLAAVESMPEERAGQVLSMPFGTLSMYQVGEFVFRHTERHRAQIDRCVQANA